ncbi:MAG: DHH family phosphoesterase [Clostridia bacterium]|nr:DHH family phosphoesterase [Clostridia bacterium]
MKRKIRIGDVFPFVLLTAVTALAVVTGILGHPVICLIELGVTAALAAGVILFSLSSSKRARRQLEDIARQMGESAGALTRLGLPVMAVEEGEIIWYNAAFLKQIVGGVDCIGKDVDFLVRREALEAAFIDGIPVDYASHPYVLYACRQKERILCYFVDQTELTETRARYLGGRPVVAYITVDNIDDLQRDGRDSEKAQINGAIEKRIENWSSEMHAVCRRLNHDRFILVTDEEGFSYMVDTRFDILRKVKDIDFGDRGSATLSVGVGRGGANLAVCEELARQALDMALGRGGDQAAVRNPKDFEFYGGTASTVSKRSKVRTRMDASALRELIDASDSVLLMGHRFADLDAFGACFGFWRAVTDAGKPCRIVLDKEKCLCGGLVDYVTENCPGETLLITPQEALASMTKRTLLIVADTHRPGFVDSPEVLEAASTVVVIDHHRKTVDYIASAVIFYHEPYASSACEMVSELLQYMTSRIGRVEAEALLAGIMLDTRNFVLHTGVRTFESSAYLRGCGANPVTVKGFFQNSIEVYKLRAAIVASAHVYDRCAVAVAGSDHPEIRIAAAQAADEMLGIENVDASFVAFSEDGVINISARSLGQINVQLIMEKLGGGGHLTMAAAQLKDISAEEALARLADAIEAYRKENE